MGECDSIIVKGHNKMTVKDIPAVDRALKREFKAHDAPMMV